MAFTYEQADLVAHWWAQFLHGSEKHMPEAVKPYLCISDEQRAELRKSYVSEPGELDVSKETYDRFVDAFRTSLMAMPAKDERIMDMFWVDGQTNRSKTIMAEAYSNPNLTTPLTEAAAAIGMNFKDLAMTNFPRFARTELLENGQVAFSVTPYSDFGGKGRFTSAFLPEGTPQPIDLTQLPLASAPYMVAEYAPHHTDYPQHYTKSEADKIFGGQRHWHPLGDDYFMARTDPFKLIQLEEPGFVGELNRHVHYAQKGDWLAVSTDGLHAKVISPIQIDNKIKVYQAQTDGTILNRDKSYRPGDALPVRGYSQNAGELSL